MGGTEGRALHLLDVEYLGLGPTVTADDLALVLEHYRPLVGWHEGDHLVGAASHHVYERIAFHNRIKERGYRPEQLPDGTWVIHRPDGQPITPPV